MSEFAKFRLPSSICWAFGNHAPLTGVYIFSYQAPSTGANLFRNQAPTTLDNLFGNQAPVILEKLFGNQVPLTGIYIFSNRTPQTVGKTFGTQILPFCPNLFCSTKNITKGSFEYYKCASLSQDVLIWKLYNYRLNARCMRASQKDEERRD
ncbi:MAG: hypothetical protein EZS28_000110 [Streblomastix strix]|uniref:Uncharacterized protein n=1 Tax=Streblomastix strix TaxID=222440 RepID=A0A5J4XCX3_9EUKA|nr:MAG: hypothetical protein EZS28_000110 [Streblomastix strix]